MFINPEIREPVIISLVFDAEHSQDDHPCFVQLVDDIFGQGFFQ
jgi:hypothetical protein